MNQITTTDERCIAQIVCALRFMIDTFKNRATTKEEEIIVNEAFAALCFVPLYYWHLANDIENLWEIKIVKKDR